MLASARETRPTRLIMLRISLRQRSRAWGGPRRPSAWLQEAASTGFPCYSLFERDPNLDPIRQDPHFRTFMAEMQKSSASLRRVLFPDSN